MRPRWSDTYLIGHPTMDAQHKEILEYAALLVEARTCEMQVLCAKGLHALALAHFAYEEALMHNVQYPCTKEHTEQHRELLSRLDEIQYEIAAKNLDLNNFEIHVTEWLVTHIVNFDAEVSAHMNGMEYWGCDVD